jgi:hypothetical protein
MEQNITHAIEACQAMLFSLQVSQSSQKLTVHRLTHRSLKLKEQQKNMEYRLKMIQEEMINRSELLLVEHDPEQELRVARLHRESEIIRNKLYSRCRLQRVRTECSIRIAEQTLSEFNEAIKTVKAERDQLARSGTSGL